MRTVRQPAAESQPRVVADLTTIAVIQALIPLGLRAVEEQLQAEVAALAGARYARDDGRPGIVRWGAQPGSVFLADQKLPVTVPRVRDLVHGREVPLPSYQALQTPRAHDAGLYRRVLAGIATREYHDAAEAVPEAMGLSRTSVSRRFIRASARALAQLQTRALAGRDWIALMLDGKTFSGEQLVLALGITRTGEKVLLGLVQTATENRAVCASFLRALGERGFPLDRALLVVLDGAKGLRAAVRDTLPRAVVQRCQWHKRENVVRYLPKTQQPLWRRKLQAAYAQPTLAQAHAALAKLRRELQLVNASAAASLDEGLDETLTLHRLGVFRELGTSFKTTNLIESVNARVEARRRRVTRWRTSDQKQRWCAAALLAHEVQFRRIKGHEHLGLLDRALHATLPASLITAA
jgi:transposase-like protein